MKKELPVKWIVGGIALAYLVLVGIVVFLLVAPITLLSEFDLGERASVAQAIVELGGLGLAIIVGGIAIWVFRASRLRPELRLFLQDEGQEELTTSIIWTNPIEEQFKYFTVVVKNTGPEVATFIRVDIMFEGSHLWFYPKLNEYFRNPALAGTPFLKYWPLYDTLPSGTRYTFFGKDDIVCYGDGRTLDIGRFAVRLFPEAQYPPKGDNVWFTIEARGFLPKKGSFHFKVVTPDEAAAHSSRVTRGQTDP